MYTDTAYIYLLALRQAVGFLWVGGGKVHHMDDDKDDVDEHYYCCTTVPLFLLKAIIAVSNGLLELESWR